MILQEQSPPVSREGLVISANLHFSCHCEERSDVAISPPSHFQRSHIQQIDILFVQFVQNALEIFFHICPSFGLAHEGALASLLTF